MKKAKKRILVVAAAVLAAVLAIGGVIVFIAKSQYDKERLLSSFEAPDGQTVYILGTLHFRHFKRAYDYSMRELISCIDAINPDAVYIEAREKTYESYGVIDGPIDMIVAYSHCVEESIPVRMIDWWELNDSARSNTTNDERDGHIFENILAKLNAEKSGATVLIVCGAAHYHEQAKRMLEAGFAAREIATAEYFRITDNGSFTYPETAAEVVAEKIEYLREAFPNEIAANISDESVAKAWRENAAALCEALAEQKTLVESQALYD